MALDVYGDNARNSADGVCVGAMMVGSIQTTVQEGEYLQRGQEFGCFAFGVFF